MNNTTKILNLIKEDKEIADVLFLFYEFPEDFSLWTGKDGKSDFDFSNMDWLFVTEQPNLSLVGLNTKDNSVWCIDDEGDFHQDCQSFQDLPYEIIKIESRFTENSTVEEYFEKFPNHDFKSILKRYEIWCKENNIELDKQKIYHDENGNLIKSFY